MLRWSLSDIRLFPKFILLSWGFGLCTVVHSRADAPPTPIPQSFRQEVAQTFSTDHGLPGNDIQLLDAARDGSLRVLVRGVWNVQNASRWTRLGDRTPAPPPTLQLFDDQGRAWDTGLPSDTVRQVLRGRNRVWIRTQSDVFEWRGENLESLGWPNEHRAHQIACDQNGKLVLAASNGLFELTEKGWAEINAIDSVGRLWTRSAVNATVFDSAGNLWAATAAGVLCRRGTAWTFYEGKDGVPVTDFQGAASGPNAAVWFASRRGLVYWDGAQWHYRQGRRWLPDDDVRQVWVDGKGAVWAATSKGLGFIEHRTMTLAQKAEHYEHEIATYIQRTPFGYVAEARLRHQADKSSADPDDSDNDGLWTSMYGAGECFAFGATKSPAAKKRARRAFEALRFLQQVTQGGSPAPPPGYIARTIRSTELPDPNHGRLESDRRTQASHDSLWKVYDPRWPKSADGKWFWKSDTSSDELDGHYFFYALYHELCAETESERSEVASVVRGVTDHLMAHDWTLQDIDGKPTRWAVYGPQFVNQHPLWWPERGLNSLSLLSYLAVAHHITGDSKYANASQQLIDRHAYAHNAMFPKVQHGVGSGNQSDDEMAFMCYYTLLRYSRNEPLKSMIRYSLFRYWANEAPEMNPFFNFVAAVHCSNKTATFPWGEFSVTPWAGWLQDSAATLQGFPLDRLNWSHSNSHRLDLVRLPKQQAIDLYDAREQNRGHRVNGKVLPVENRHFNHWNTDPWQLDYGGNGNELASGAVFLLPYYMGLFHGYVEKPTQ